MKDVLVWPADPNIQSGFFERCESNKPTSAPAVTDPKRLGASPAATSQTATSRPSTLRVSRARSGSITNGLTECDGTMSSIAELAATGHAVLRVRP